MLKLEPKIIWENEDLLVLGKPAGLPVHGDGQRQVATLVDWLLEHYPGIENIGEHNPDYTPHVGTSQNATFSNRLPGDNRGFRAGLIHRLDKDTSGLILIAKNQNTFDQLQKQFQLHTVIKHYRALVYGKVKEATGTISFPIGRSRQDPRRRQAGHGAVGTLREARTVYQVLENFPGYTYLEAAPLTGRTHQLRVHFQAIGHPIVGDQLYRPTDLPAGASGLEWLKTRQIPGLNRQALHAYYLKINLPDGPSAPAGKPKEFTAPLPPDFEAALEYLRRL